VYHAICEYLKRRSRRLSQFQSRAGQPVLNALFRLGKQRAYARRRPPRLPSRPPASPPLRGILLSVLVTPYRFSSSGKYQVREAEQFCGRSSQRNRGTAKNEATRIFDGATRALAAAKTCGQLSAA